MKFRSIFFLACCFVVLLHLSCKSDDSPDDLNTPEGTESAELPSWNIDSYTYIRFNIENGYSMTLIGDYDATEDLTRGILVSKDQEPTLESAELKGVIPKYDTNPTNFVIDIHGLEANTTYYLRPYKELADRVDYGEIFTISTLGFNESCHISSQTGTTGASNTFSDSKSYSYNAGGRLIKYTNTVGSIGRGLTPTSETHLYRYEGNSVFRTKLATGESMIRDELVGTFENNRIATWTHSEQSYTYIYPDDQTVAIKIQGNGATDSLVHQLNSEGNIELSQSFRLNEGDYELISESRYNYSEFTNPFRGNIEEFNWAGYFTTHLIASIEKRTLPSADFETVADYLPKIEAVNRDSDRLFYSRYDLRNIIHKESCD